MNLIFKKDGFTEFSLLKLKTDVSKRETTKRFKMSNFRLWNKI